MESECLKNAMGPGQDCPTIQRLAYYADGLLPVAELQADEAHISTCAHCLTELELLRAFTTYAAAEDRDWAFADGVTWLRRREVEIFGANHVGRNSWKKWFPSGRLQPAVTLAAVVLAMGVGYYMKGPAAPQLPAEVGTGAEVTRSLRVHLFGPKGDVTAVPDRLAWEPVSGAVSYRVRVLEVDRQEVWSGEVAATAVDLPVEVRTRISPAKTLEWQVTAYGVDRRPIAESDPQRFRLMK